MSGARLKEESLTGLYDLLARAYDMDSFSCTLGGERFDFFSVRDSYALLDRISPEEFARDEQMPYWAEIWPSSLSLAEYMISELDLSGRKVIELGSGVGVAGIAAARKGGRVVATDYSSEAVKFMRLNALQNSVALECRQLDWRSIGIEDRFDVLVAADVLYERGNLLPIIGAIDALLQPDGCAWIADPRRRLAQQFLELAFENGFSVSTFPRCIEHGAQQVHVNIYRIDRKRCASG
ncbi:methyltransferase [Prosthecochloris sp. HL-130-GSB]|uniref:class I SAM-dependent methyltransferase n=1 Tax=Prosthecochloris sp. HL-130-GSB TaxID=1974213 RepID=UPI000A1C09E6|nr:methyltransferase domain-containing protein [Prosthecochloris sp. HL-130-GSB]ARM30385.1 methyltransferase type 12 [Prosthecochloris sp. HL-130-GSB]